MERTVQFIRHVIRDEIESHEIVAQSAPAVFAAFHVRFEIIPEQRDIQHQSPRLRCLWNKSRAEFPVVA